MQVEKHQNLLPDEMSDYTEETPKGSCKRTSNRLQSKIDYNDQFFIGGDVN